MVRLTFIFTSFRFILRHLLLSVILEGPQMETRISMATGRSRCDEPSRGHLSRAAAKNRNENDRRGEEDLTRVFLLAR